jgi:hypothetical protein
MMHVPSAVKTSALSLEEYLHPDERRSDPMISDQEADEIPGELSGYPKPRYFLLDADPIRYLAVCSGPQQYTERLSVPTECGPFGAYMYDPAVGGDVWRWVGTIDRPPHAVGKTNPPCTILPSSFDVPLSKAYHLQWHGKDAKVLSELPAALSIMTLMKKDFVKVLDGDIVLQDFSPPTFALNKVEISLLMLGIDKMREMWRNSDYVPIGSNLWLWTAIALMHYVGPMRSLMASRLPRFDSKIPLAFVSTPSSFVREVCGVLGIQICVLDATAQNLVNIIAEERFDVIRAGATCVDEPIDGPKLLEDKLLLALGYARIGKEVRLVTATRAPSLTVKEEPHVEIVE